MNAFWWAILTACIWGVVPILEKFCLTKVDPFVALFYRCLGVLVGILFLGLFIVKPSELKAVDIRTIIILVCAGFLASFLAQVTFYHGLKIGEVSRVVPISGTYYLIAFILGIVIFSETLTLSKFLGIILIFSGVLLLR